MKNVTIRNTTPSMSKFYAGRARMLHKSCDVAMLPDPMNPDGPSTTPWVQRPGITYNIGRNAAKREARLRRLPA